MPNIVFANVKGGSGKTTAVSVLASELYAANARVCILEGDVNRAQASWAAQRGFPVIDTKKVSISSAQEASQVISDAVGDRRLVVIAADGEEGASLLDWIEAASGWAQFVLADPEGSRNLWLDDVVSQADLVVVPFAPTTLDVNMVIETIRYIAHKSRTSNRAIPYRAVLTRTSAGAVRTRDENEIRKSIGNAGVPLLSVSLADRPAFRGIFKSGKLLNELTAEDANGLSVAQENARAFAAEILDTIRAGKAAA